MAECIWVIGDVHGCTKELDALLAKLPFSEPKILVGDLIDRGPDSSAVVARVRSEGFLCVRGNHEQMAAGRDYQLWMYNGGYPTQNSYVSLSDERWEADLEWMRQLPLVITPEVVVNDRGQTLQISHSYVGNWHNALEPDSEEGCLWTRRFPRAASTAPLPAVYQMFGHTPHKAPFITEQLCCLDTGCVYQNGGLTAVRWPDMRVVTLKGVDL